MVPVAAPVDPSTSGGASTPVSRPPTSAGKAGVSSIQSNSAVGVRARSGANAQAAAATSAPAVTAAGPPLSPPPGLYNSVVAADCVFGVGERGGAAPFVGPAEGASYAFRPLRVTRVPSARAVALARGRPTVRARPRTPLAGCYRSGEEARARRAIEDVLRRPVKGERPLSGWGRREPQPVHL